MLTRFLLGGLVLLIWTEGRGSVPCPITLSDEYSVIRCSNYKSFIENTSVQEENLDKHRSVYILREKEIVHKLPPPVVASIFHFLPLEKKPQEKPSNLDLKNIDIIDLYREMLKNKAVYCWVAFSEEAKNIRSQMKKSKQLARVIFYRLLFKEKFILEDNLKNYSSQKLCFKEGDKIYRSLEWESFPFGGRQKYLYITAKDVKDFAPQGTDLSKCFKDIDNIYENSLIKIEIHQSIQIEYKPKNLPCEEEIITLPGLQKAWPYTNIFEERPKANDNHARIFIEAKIRAPFRWETDQNPTVKILIY